MLRGDPSDGLPGVPGHRREDGGDARRPVRVVGGAARGGDRPRRHPAQPAGAQQARRGRALPGGRGAGGAGGAGRPGAAGPRPTPCPAAPVDPERLDELAQRWGLGGSVERLVARAGGRGSRRRDAPAARPSAAGRNATAAATPRERPRGGDGHRDPRGSEVGAAPGRRRSVANSASARGSAAGSCTVHQPARRQLGRARGRPDRPSPARRRHTPAPARTRPAGRPALRRRRPIRYTPELSGSRGSCTASSTGAARGAGREGARGERGGHVDQPQPRLVAARR